MTKSVTIRLYEELNELLPKELQKKDFVMELGDSADAGRVMSELGISPASIDLILINGYSCDISAVPEDGDRLSFYPVFESLDISGISRLPYSPLRTPGFMCEKNLSKLAETLRGLGFDAETADNELSEEHIKALNREGRILLTRNTQIFSIKEPDRVILVKEKDTDSQVREILARLDLEGPGS